MEYRGEKDGKYEFNFTGWYKTNIYFQNGTHVKFPRNSALKYPMQYAEAKHFHAISIKRKPLKTFKNQQTSFAI